MARIFDLNIKNYRRFENFSYCFHGKNVICLAGRGDSGKSTILDAIAAVLSPAWNLSFYDNDFHDLNTEIPIEITATLIDIPDSWKVEDKFGLFYKGYDPAQNVIVEHYDGELLPAIKVCLSIDKTLEPSWEIVNDISGERKAISAGERAKLNVFCISDYMDRHFSLSTGSPLYSLLRQEDGSIDSQILVNAVREIKERLDRDDAFPDLKPILEKISAHAAKLSLCLDNLIPTLDSRDLSIKEGKICIHNSQKIPLRLNGKGSKRIASIAIQLATTDKKGIVLVDEIEQGLEPDRAKCLITSLKKEMNDGQIFFSTHSSEVIRELKCSDILRLNDNNELQIMSNDLQGLIRACPEMMFSKGVILCEGATEVGFCRALNSYRIANGKPPLSYSGVVIIDGTGDAQVKYARGIRSLGIPLLWFCDSDKATVNQSKDDIRQMGAHIVDWNNNDSFEKALFRNVENLEVVELLSLAKEIISTKCEITPEEACQRIIDSVSTRHRAFRQELNDKNFSLECRSALASSATVDKKEWFKSVTNGEAVGDVIIPHIASYSNDNELCIKIGHICQWVDNV